MSLGSLPPCDAASGPTCGVVGEGRCLWEVIVCLGDVLVLAVGIALTRHGRTGTHLISTHFVRCTADCGTRTADGRCLCVGCGRRCGCAQGPCACARAPGNAQPVHAQQRSVRHAELWVAAHGLQPVCMWGSVCRVVVRFAHESSVVWPCVVEPGQSNVQGGAHKMRLSVQLAAVCLFARRCVRLRC